MIYYICFIYTNQNLCDFIRSQLFKEKTEKLKA